MTNAETARAWMAEVVAEPGTQFAALSSATDKTAAFGIDPARVFGFEDWVGGRYSMWGPIGLPVMLAVGPEAFDAMLAGGRAMDSHFREADLAENLPVLLALVGIWHNQGCGYASRAVLPYDQRLLRPACLSATARDGVERPNAWRWMAAICRSIPARLFGASPGRTVSTRSIRLIHQGTRVVPCEFMVAAKGHEADLGHHHRLLVANCLAQAEALMLGRDLETARAMMAAKGLSGDELERQARHRVFPGNRPSTMLLYPQLTPYVFGQIIALYEHRVFVEGAILGINSFDQWGVELGKELALKLAPLLDGADANGKDGSTAALIAAIRAV